MAVKSGRTQKTRSAYEIAGARVERELSDDMQAAFKVRERLKEEMRKRKDRLSGIAAGAA